MSCNILQKRGVAAGALRVAGWVSVLSQPGLSGQWGEAHCKEMFSGPGLLNSCPLVKAIQQTFTEQLLCTKVETAMRKPQEMETPGCFQSLPMGQLRDGPLTALGSLLTGMPHP